MPFKSEKQKKYFFAKLNSLPKGSPEYNKWKKVVDKFVAHSVDESLDLNEEDRYEPAWVDKVLNKIIYFKIPLTNTVINKIFGKQKKIESFHITSENGLNNLKNIIGKRNSISTLKYLDEYSLGDLYGIQTEGGIIIKVEGLLSVASGQDIMSTLDYSLNRRWVDASRLSNSFRSDLKKRIGEWFDKRNSNEDYTDMGYIKQYMKFVYELIDEYKIEISGKLLREILENGGTYNEILVSNIRVTDIGYIESRIPSLSPCKNIDNWDSYELNLDIKCEEVKANFNKKLQELNPQSITVFDSEDNRINFQNIKKWFINHGGFIDSKKWARQHYNKFIVSDEESSNKFLKTSSVGIQTLLSFSKDPDKVAEIIINNKYGRNGRDIYYDIIYYLVYCNDIIKISKLIGDDIVKTFIKAKGVTSLFDNCYKELYSMYVKKTREQKKDKLNDIVNLILHLFGKNIPNPKDDAFTALLKYSKEPIELLKLFGNELIIHLEKNKDYYEKILNVNAKYSPFSNPIQIKQMYDNYAEKIVPSKYAEYIDESYELDEARRNPDVNYEQPVAKQIEQFVDKYKGQEDLIFISFRNSIHVTLINPNNTYNTPTGIYTYPWQNYYDDRFEKYIKDYLVADTSKNIPFGGDRKYMFIYKLKSNQGILTNKTTYNDTLPYAKKLFNLVKNNDYALEIVNAYINDYDRYINNYYNSNQFRNNYFADIHKFWILLYEVAEKITKGKLADTVGNLCRAIGVNGFVDFEGLGYIHPSEPHQAVFFKGRNLFEDIKIIDTKPSESKIYNRNLYRYLTDKESVANLNGDKVQNLLNQAPNVNFINLIIDTLLSNRDFVSNMDSKSLFLIIRKAKILDNSTEKIDRIINIVLSNKNFLDKESSEKINILFSDVELAEQRKKIINILLENENFLNKIYLEGIRTIVNYSTDKDNIINFIINNKTILSNIYNDKVSDKYLIIFLFSNTSEENDKVIDTLFNVGGKEFMMNLPIEDKQSLLRYTKDPEKVIHMLGGKEFLMNLSTKDIGKLLINLGSKVIEPFLSIGGKEFIMNLDSQGIFNFLYFSSKDSDKIKKVLLDGGLSKDAINQVINNSGPLKSMTPIDENLNKNNMKTPLDEIFKSLGFLKEELNEQNKVNIKEKNLEKVKQFLSEKRKPLLEDEFYFNTLPDDKKESIYNLFKQSYEGSVGTSWSKDKFYSRAYDWLFFGDENGFVSVRPQKSGLYKLVGVAGGLKSILNGFNELQSKNVPIWGMVSKDIQQMAHKKGFITPPPFLLKILYKIIPNSVFGNTEFDVNSDGSLTLKYSDVGDAVKYFIGNDEYFKNLKSNILPSMKDEFSKLPSLTKMMINKFLPESVNTLNEELLDEDITSGSVTVYHRTGSKTKSPVEGISADGYRVGKGAFYGIGVYTTYDLESQLNPNMIKAYGNIIIESKVLSLDKFLIFDYDIAKKIYGNVNYTLDNQLRLILGKDWNKFKDDTELKNIIEQITVDKYSSDVARKFYQNFNDTIFKYLRGVVLTGEQDGKVLISYDRKNVEPLRYTTDEGQTWTNIINKNIYQRLKGYKPEEIDTEYEHFINKLDARPGTLTFYDVDYIVNNFDKFRKNINSNNIYDILSNSSINNRNFIINKLLQDTSFIDRLNRDGMLSLVSLAGENRDKVIDVLLQNNNIINRLDTNSSARLIEYSNTPEKVIDALGEKGKNLVKNAGKDFITDIIVHSKEPEKIFNFLEGKKENYISNLEGNDIYRILNFSKEPEKIIDEFIKDVNFIIDSYYSFFLLCYTNNPKRVINSLGKYRDRFISKVVSSDIRYLLTKSIETEKLVKELNKYTPKMQEYINDLSFDDIYDLINKATHPEKLFNVLGQKGIEFINKVNDENLIDDLIDDSINELEIEKLVNKYVKNSKNTLNEELLDEDITSGSVTVYHRTGKRGDSAVQGIAADGYRVGGGAMYGIGVYTTYDLESQLQDYLKNSYGNIIIESKVLSMDKFLIFDYDVAKKVYGNVNYTLDNQLRLIVGKNWRYFKDNSNLKKLIEQVAIVKYTADVADDFYKTFKDTIVKYLRGIVFTGRNDGKVLVSYDRKNIEPLRYTTDEAQTWTNILNKNIYQRLKGYKSEERETYIEHIINKLEVNRNELTESEIKYIINNIPLILKRGLSFTKIINLVTKITDDKKKTIEHIKYIFEKYGDILSSNTTKDDIIYLLKGYNMPEVYSNLIIKFLIKYSGYEFVNKLIDGDVDNLYMVHDRGLWKTIINIALKYNGKEFLLKNFSKLSTMIYGYFDLYRKSAEFNDNTDKFINKMIKIGGKELLYKLANNTIIIGNSSMVVIQNLLYKITNKNFDSIIDNMIKIGGKEFVNSLINDIVYTLYSKYKDFESLTHKLVKIGGKEFIDKNRPYIVLYAPTYQDRKKIEDIFNAYDKEKPTTPMNEIFNSLTSLQEELTEQRKISVKETNLMKVQNFIKMKRNNQK